MITKRESKQILFVLGLFFFSYLLHKIGWEALVRDFRLLGWSIVLILALNGIKYAISALAWATTFFPEERQSWKVLFGRRLAGEALNYLSLAGPLMSEPAKASLVKGVGFAPALASTLVESVLNTIAASLVSVAGLALLLVYQPLSWPLRLASVLVIALLLAFCLGVPYALQRGVPFLTWGWRRVRHLNWLSAPKLGEKLALAEERLLRLRAEKPGALWTILLLSLATQGLALLEVYAVLLPLGITPYFSSIVMMEAFTKLAKALFFFIPARIGADEGSSAGIFVLMGLAPTAGLTLAFARRLRALFWSAIGLLYLFSQSLNPAGQEQSTVAQPLTKLNNLPVPGDATVA